MICPILFCGNQVAICSKNMILTAKALIAMILELISVLFLFTISTCFLLAQFYHSFVLFDVCDTFILYIMMYVIFPSLYDCIILYIKHNTVLIFSTIIHVYGVKAPVDYKDYNKPAAFITFLPPETQFQITFTCILALFILILTPAAETASCIYNIHFPSLLLTNEISDLLKLTLWPAKKPHFPVSLAKINGHHIVRLGLKFVSDAVFCFLSFLLPLACHTDVMATAFIVTLWLTWKKGLQDHRNLGPLTLSHCPCLDGLLLYFLLCEQKPPPHLLSQYWLQKNYI